jgi:hypothetical protein
VWDGHGLTSVVREFIRSALRQPAVADFVGEHFFDGDEPPAGIGDALRLAVVEMLGTITSEDWDQVASYLLAYAHECMEDGAGVASPPGAPAQEGWAPPPRFLRRPSTRRKPPVRVEPSRILVWLIERGSATTREIARHFDISEGTAWAEHRPARRAGVSRRTAPPE